MTIAGGLYLASESDDSAAEDQGVVYSSSLTSRGFASPVSDPVAGQGGSTSRQQVVAGSLIELVAGEDISQSATATAAAPASIATAHAPDAATPPPSVLQPTATAAATAIATATTSANAPAQASSTPVPSPARPAASPPAAPAAPAAATATPLPPTSTATAVPPTTVPPTATPTRVPPTATPVPPTATPTTAPPPAAPVSLTAMEQSMFALHNSQRAANGLGALQIDSALVSFARQRAQDMASKNYFSHTSPSGVTAFSIMDGAGYVYSLAGENIARNNYADDQSVNVAMSGFMESPTHRRNILEGRFTRVGIGVVMDGAGMKYYVVIFAG